MQSKYEKLESKLLLSNAQPLPGDDDPLDLSGALVDLVDLGISHQLLHGVFGVETIATKNLNSVSGRLKKITMTFAIYL